MTKIVWTKKPYEAGVDRGVFYWPVSADGLPWNGLTAVTETPSFASEGTYFDGVRVNTQTGQDDFLATLEAVTYPQQIEDMVAHEGVALGLEADQQIRDVFNLTYRVMHATGYYIHLVYNAKISPTEKRHGTLGGEISPAEFSWDLSTTPRSDITGAAPSAHLIVDSSLAIPSQLAILEDSLYGSAISQPYMPDPAGVISLMLTNPVMVVTDNGDGTWTATGPDSAFTWISGTQFEIDWPSVVYLDSETYNISSM